jgi:hypothetical protein
MTEAAEARLHQQNSRPAADLIEIVEVLMITATVEALCNPIGMVRGPPDHWSDRGPLSRDRDCEVHLITEATMVCLHMIGMVEALLITGMIVAYLLLKVMVEAKPPRI